MNAHAITFAGIDGQPIELGDHRGHPVLVVNTASECGYTPQYAALQDLWARYRDRGLVVIGVPSNDFGNQEPGDDASILAFCQDRFAVDFPLAAKQPVIGGNAHPFYTWIVEEFGEAAAPRWNFHKYLIDGEGALVALWPSDVAPTDLQVIDAVESLLAS